MNVTYSIFLNIAGKAHGSRTFGWSVRTNEEGEYGRVLHREEEHAGVPVKLHGAHSRKVRTTRVTIGIIGVRVGLELGLELKLELGYSWVRIAVTVGVRVGVGSEGRAEVMWPGIDNAVCDVGSIEID